MTKNDSASYVASKLGLSKEYAKKVLDCFLEYIKREVVSGEQVQLRGFGRFYAQKRAAKVGRNINKNTAIVIPAAFVPKFKASKSFSLKVQEGKEEGL